MSPERFEHLFNLVGPLIAKQDTNYRKSIPAKKRLVITLRYLAEGCSQQALSLGFRVGKSTVSKILKEVCETLYTVLATHYLRPPSTNKFRISKVAEQASCDWSNRWQACSHGVPKKYWVIISQL